MRASLLGPSRSSGQRGILESEPFGIPFRSPKTWPSLSDPLAKDAGCDTAESTDACLMAVDPPTLMVAQKKAEDNLLDNIGHLLDVFVPWTPTTGTEELPLAPWDAWTQNKTHDVPIMIGTGKLRMRFRLCAPHTHCCCLPS